MQDLRRREKERERDDSVGDNHLRERGRGSFLDSLEDKEGRKRWRRRKRERETPLLERRKKTRSGRKEERERETEGWGVAGEDAARGGSVLFGREGGRGRKNRRKKVLR